MICPNCNTVNPQNVTECIGCGSALPVVQCTRGTINAQTNKFCYNCGAKLSASSSPGVQETIQLSSITGFSEKEYKILREINRRVAKGDGNLSTVSQDDIDKLFE